MATPYDNAGGLLGMDPETIKRLIEQMRPLMEQFAPNEADRRGANNQALIAAGLSMLGTRKGEEWDRLGYAGMNALNAQQGTLAGAVAGKRAQWADAQSAMGMLDKMRAQQQSVADQKALGGIFGGGAPGPALAGAVPAPTGTPAPVAAGGQAGAYRQAAAFYAARGDAAKAKVYAEIADKMEEEYATTLQPVKGADGVIRMVQVGKRGGIKTADGLTPAEKLQFVNAGGNIIPSDPYTGAQAGGAIPVTVDANAQLSSETARRGQNMTDARAREFNAISRANAPPGEIRETADGFVRIGRDNTVTPILAGGAPLQAKPTGQVQQQIASNAVTLGKIDRAIDLVNKNEDAFGLKNLAGDVVMQRMNPSGVEARAMLADIAGQKIHDRSGAAVTVGESERLKPYIPNATDTADTIKKKLGLFKNEYMAMQQELAGGRSIAEASGAAKAKTVKWSDLP